MTNPFDTSAGCRGPLAGLRVVEFASMGPGPHAAMMLADLGAEVLRIDRPGGLPDANPLLDRGRATIDINLRDPAGRDRALAIVEKADVLIEGNRPGVMERLGLGPDAVLARNPGLIYGRMTGWGQTGPLAQRAGHDLTYLAITGALAGIGLPGQPAVPPLNLVGDFGGGSTYLVFGILAALYERQSSGLGQIVDAAIVDGVHSLMAMFTGFAQTGRISMARERNLLGGAAPFYRCYLCSDGREIAVGAIEPHFYRNLLEAIEAPLEWLDDQNNAEAWPERCAQMASIFLTRTRDEWAALLDGLDACAAPVLELAEVPAHPHNRDRRTHVMQDSLWQNMPAPRLSRTPGQVRGPVDAEAMLSAWQAAADN